MQRVTIHLKEPSGAVEEFENVTEVLVREGVYVVRTADETTSTFPVHNVLSSFATT